MTLPYSYQYPLGCEYLGCHEIARTITDYLKLPKKKSEKIKDIVNRFFTQLDCYTKKLSCPYDVFWGLGDAYWKQVIERGWHHLGSEVFDKGLHKGVVEPGFLKSIEQCMRFLTSTSEPFSLDIYRKAHQKAICHFKPRNKKVTACGAELGGVFERCRGTEFEVSEFFLADPLPPKVKQDYLQEAYTSVEWVKKRTQYQPINESTAALRRDLNMTPEQFEESLEQAEAFRYLFERDLDERVKKMNKYIQFISKEMGSREPLGDFFILQHTPNKIDLTYASDTDETEMLTRFLITRLNKEIASTETSDERIEVIARFIQAVELLHPFSDGQGRLDNAVLAYLLSIYGTNPSLLDKPYFSSTNTLKDWVSYLSTGIEDWQREYKRLCAEYEAIVYGAELIMEG